MSLDLLHANMKPLVEIPFTQWSGLLNVFKIHKTECIAAFCILETHITYSNIRDALNFKVFCPGADFSYGMIATTDQGNWYEVMIFPTPNNMKKLEESLLGTHLIEWRRVCMFPCASPAVLDFLNRAHNQFGLALQRDENSVAIRFVLNKNSLLFDCSICPPNTYVDQLKPEYLDLVDETWTFHSERSRIIFEILMKNGATYVLYSSIDDKPLAWITIGEEGSLSHLYCLDQHRRKGYAEFITKIAANDLLQKRKDVLAHALQVNFKAISLFSKLGFEESGIDVWVCVKQLE